MRGGQALWGKRRFSGRRGDLYLRIGEGKPQYATAYKPPAFEWSSYLNIHARADEGLAAQDHFPLLFGRVLTIEERESSYVAIAPSAVEIEHDGVACRVDCNQSS